MNLSIATKNQLPTLALLIVAISWGWSFAFTKEIFQYIGPIAFTAYSFLVPSTIFFAIAIYKKNWNILYRIKEGAFLGALLCLVELPQTIGLFESSAQNTAFISNSGILLLPLFGYFVLREKLRAQHIYALILCALGIYVFTGGIDHLISGDYWLFLSAIGMPLYFGFSAKYEREWKSDIYLLCGQQFFVCGAIAFLFIEKTPVVWSQPLLINFVLIAFFANLLPYFLAQWAERKVTTVLATFVYTLEPIFGGYFAWTIGHEIITRNKIIGGLLIVLAMLISQIRKNEAGTIHGVKRRKMATLRRETT